MRGFMRCCLALALAGLTLGACASPGIERRATLARAIADDAIAFNEAYSGAINGQILLNILRAADRQPRQYMAMSGFASDAPGTRGATLGVAGVELGQLGESWGAGSVGLSASERTAPSFEVSPFGADDFANIALRPTSIAVFRHYWDTGWNPDLLLFVLVDRMEVSAQDGTDQRLLYNSPGTIDRDCVGEVYSFGGCAFVRAARDLAQDVRASGAPAPSADLCAPIVYADDGATSARSAPAERTQPEARAIGFGGPCPIVVEVGGRRYTLSLRSLDAMVYYVGELLRANERGDAAVEGVMTARLGAIAPGAFRPEDRAPLFRVVRADAHTERAYAATVSYAGARYSAGAPVSRFCFDPASRETCGAGLDSDRSGSVLELLAGVLAYNQSTQVVSAPEGAVLSIR